jgi:hypothetical protein
MLRAADCLALHFTTHLVATLSAPSAPQMQAWRPIADMADARAYGSCAVLGGTLFAVGGLQSDMQVRGAGCPISLLLTCVLDTFFLVSRFGHRAHALPMHAPPPTETFCLHNASGCLNHGLTRC